LSTRVFRCINSSAYGLKSEITPKQVACVELANELCSLKGISSVGVRLVELRKPAMDLLELDAVGLKDLTTKIEAELGLHEDLMALR
jgi:hypothetical protein